MIQYSALHCISLSSLDPAAYSTPRQLQDFNILLLTRSCHVTKLTKFAPHRIATQKILLRILSPNYCILVLHGPRELTFRIQPQNATSSNPAIIQCGYATCPGAPLVGVSSHTGLYPCLRFFFSSI